MVHDEGLVHDKGMVHDKGTVRDEGTVHDEDSQAAASWLPSIDELPLRTILAQEGGLPAALAAGIARLTDDAALARENFAAFGSSVESGGPRDAR